MVIECGNGYIIYISTEEYCALTDDEFNEIIKTRCFPAADPYYTSGKKINFMEGTFDEDIPEHNYNLNEILNIIDTQALDTTDFRTPIEIDLDDLDNIDDIEKLNDDDSI